MLSLSVIATAFSLALLCGFTQSYQLMDGKFLSNRKFAQLNTAEIINYYGYPGEEHNMTTEDGYILNNYRMANPVGFPVLLMHGFTATSDCFLVKGPPFDIPFRLWRRGYDVWFMNSRGNLYSWDHVNKTAAFRQKKYFKFSVEDYFRYDEAATIDYILNKTGHKSLITLGHSLSTMYSLGLAAVRPEFNDKIALSVLWSQAVFSSNTILKGFIDVGNTWLQIAVPNDLFGPEGAMGGEMYLALVKATCGPDAHNLLKEFCYFGLGGVSGWQSNQTDYNAVQKMVTKFPSGTSRNAVIQTIQIVMSGRFAPLSYSRKENLKKYGAPVPPPYPIETVTTPVAMFYCHRDFMSHKKDNFILKNHLQNVPVFKEIPYKYFDHGDFLWSKDAYQLLYKDALTVIHQYTPEAYKSKLPIYDIADPSNFRRNWKELDKISKLGRGERYRAD